MFGKEWDRIRGWQYIAFGGIFSLFAGLLSACEPGFVWIVDHANLLFHEAGHPLVGILSQRLEPYGGTIGQLTFPVVVTVIGWRRSNLLLAAGGMIWFFENFLNIARYMSDARTLKLPLVGGGDHDWNTILARWDILMYDTRIADVLKIIGWLGMVIPVLLVFAHAFIGASHVRHYEENRSPLAAEEL